VIPEPYAISYLQLQVEQTPLVHVSHPDEDFSLPNEFSASLAPFTVLTTENTRWVSALPHFGQFTSTVSFMPFEISKTAEHLLHL